MKVVEEIKDPVEAINWLGFTRDSVLIADNLHLFLDIPEVIQAIQNGVPRWKGIGNALVMISPLIQFNPEIEKFFTIIDLPLPDEESLHTLQVELCKSVNVNPNKRASRVAKGLTEFEAETAFALSLIKKGYCSTKVISEAKSQMIRRSGLLEFWTPESIKDVGGLNQLKMFIANRAKAFEIGNEHLPRPRGVILCGIPGTGKSIIMQGDRKYTRLASHPIGHWIIKGIVGWRIRTKDAFSLRGHRCIWGVLSSGSMRLKRDSQVVEVVAIPMQEQRQICSPPF